MGVRNWMYLCFVRLQDLKGVEDEQTVLHRRQSHWWGHAGPQSKHPQPNYEKTRGWTRFVTHLVHLHDFYTLPIVNISVDFIMLKHGVIVIVTFVLIALFHRWHTLGELWNIIWLFAQSNLDSWFLNAEIKKKMLIRYLQGVDSFIQGLAMHILRMQ